MRARGWRLVCAEYVHPGQPAIQRPSERTTVIPRYPASRMSSTNGRRRTGTRRSSSPSTRTQARSSSSRWPITTTTSTIWDSKYQPWNSVAIGPQKDLIGGWAKAARDNGLPFGVTIHASHAWSFYEPAQGSDKTGRQAGVPYDGKLTKADGKGQWWDGLDPQDLYAQNHTPGKKLVWDWNAKPGQQRAGRCLLREILQPRARPDQQISSRPALLRRYRPAALSDQRRRAEDRRALLQQQRALA